MTLNKSEYILLDINVSFLKKNAYKNRISGFVRVALNIQRFGKCVFFLFA